MGERNKDEGAVTREVIPDEFTFPDERRIREKIVNIGDYMMGISGGGTGAGRVEAIVFIMVGVCAVKVVRQT